MGPPATTARAIGFCQFLLSQASVASCNLGSASTWPILSYGVSDNTPGPWGLRLQLVLAGAGRLVYAVTAGARPRLPLAAAGVLISIACWDLAPFFELRFLMRDAIFDMLWDPPALSPLFKGANLPQHCCPSKFELILGFCWAKLAVFLPPQLPIPVAALGEPSSTILRSIFCFQAGGDHADF